MAARYGLWDTESGNSLGFYETEGAALTVVRQELHEYGAEAVAGLALDCEDNDGIGTLIAEGEALIQLAKMQSPIALERSAAR